MVCDSSVIVAVLIDGGPDGTWATEAVTGAELIAPHLMPFEADNILRRHELAHLISPDQAAQAHADLLDLAVELWPHELLAERAWELRHNLTIYDAAYVALAELTDAALLTLDAALVGAPDVRCAVLTPPAARS